MRFLLFFPIESNFARKRKKIGKCEQEFKANFNIKWWCIVCRDECVNCSRQLSSVVKFNKIGRNSQKINIKISGSQWACNFKVECIGKIWKIENLIFCCCCLVIAHFFTLSSVMIQPVVASVCAVHAYNMQMPSWSDCVFFFALVN